MSTEVSNNEAKVETTQQEAAPAQSTTTATPAAAPAQADGQAPAWTPSYKFKVFGEEKEIDEELRHAIKDQNTEKKVRELYEKAYGLDIYKNKYSELDNKFRDINGKWTTREQQLSKLAKYYESGDMDSFFNTLGVPENAILQYAAKKVREMDMPEEQKRLYNENRERRTREEQLEDELNEYRQRAEQEAVLSRTFQLDNELERPDVRETVQAYDALYGNGAFRNEVIKLGQFEALKNGTDLQAKEAVAHILGKAKPIVERLGRPVQEQHKPTVIPNIKGNPATPAKRSISSMDDLRAAAAKFE